MITTKKNKRICLPKGGIQLVAKKFGLTRETASKYLRGDFDEFFANYEMALAVRRYAKETFNL